MTSPSGVKTTVAVKVLREGLDANSQAMRRLRDEARMLGAMDHPSILKVYDLTQLGGRLALVTEFVNGQDLEGTFEFGPGVPLKVLVEIIGRVAGALDAAWNSTSAITGRSLNLIHRDIKPTNIRIGRHGTVKVLDFGVARAAGLEREAETHPDAVVGTYRYLAPEALDGQVSKPEVDVYALGCTFFKGVAGDSFYGRMSLTDQTVLSSKRELHDAHLKGRLHELPGITDQAIKTLLSDMLDFDPIRRPDAAAISRRCDAIADDMKGMDLRRWCEARTWPPEGVTKGHLVGKEWTETPLDDTLDEPIASERETKQMDVDDPNFQPMPPETRATDIAAQGAVAFAGMALAIGFALATMGLLAMMLAWFVLEG